MSFQKSSIVTRKQIELCLHALSVFFYPIQCYGEPYQMFFIIFDDSDNHCY